MTIQFKRRPGKWFLSFSVRTFVLLFSFLFLANFGYLLAQGLLIDPSVLLRNAIGGSDYLFQTDLFIALRESPIIPIFGIAIIVFVVLSLGHLFTFGPKDMSDEGGDEIPWWNLFERVIHGIIAVAFVLLFISGLLITFGRYFGGGGPTLFLRQIHEFSGFVFVPALAIVILMWIREALPKLYDLQWIAHFGGYLGYKGSLKSGKFNAGQKLWYWIMLACGVLLSWSGLFLFFQVGMMSDLRMYVLIHFFAAIPIMLMFLVHLYMTTLGTKGTFKGMINGKISKKGATSYHSEAAQLK
jgi:formate dehydrogenase subunit gamma